MSKYVYKRESAMKYRWLQAPLDANLFRLLAEGVLDYQFADDLGEGFIVDESRDGYLSARFVRRREEDEILRDPFGATSTLHRVWYEYTSFNVSLGEDLIELVSPPRALKRFVTVISEIVDFQCAVDLPTVDLLKWISYIEREQNCRCSVWSLKSVRIPLTVDVAASVQLTGGIDVREHIQTLRANRGIIQSIAGEFEGVSERWSFAFGRNASARVTSVSGCNLVPGIRKALSATLSS